MDMNGEFAALLPTYNRAPALRRNLDGFLALRNMSELIVVDDGSVDETPAILASVNDERLRCLRHESNQGSPAARNTAIKAASSDWLLMLDDDCQVPEDYGEVLLRVAQRHSADIVGAPWVHAAADAIELEVDTRRKRPVHRFDLGTHHGTFPPYEVETPFLPPMVLGRRSTFVALGYRRRYRGNAWREETDFFLRAARAGYRCILTPGTYSYQSDQWSGGQRRNRIAYELWCIYNNWLFLRSHREYLRAHGLIRSAWRSQVAFGMGRLEVLVRGQLGKFARMPSRADLVPGAPSRCS
jgi:glycosyltransferase involved in cell wall biosynthesis